MMRMWQAPECVLMVKPSGFGFNPETAASNSFQENSAEDNDQKIQLGAMSEYDGLVRALRKAGVEVFEFSVTDEFNTPDAVFPNNWVSFHHDGRVILYPMMAPSRRLERRTEFIDALITQYHFRVNEVIDLSAYENQHQYLEGTGSLVIDYHNRCIYANRSPRTNPDLVYKVADLLGCSTCIFTAVDASGQDIYHTNVLMCIADTFAVVCLDAVKDPDERQQLISSLSAHGHEIVNITVHQMHQFAGNMMQLRSIKGDPILAMSESAYRSLNEDQRQYLSSRSRLVYAPIDTIETYGGGSVRCMLAGIFLPRNES
jgi:hypothetical protein